MINFIKKERINIFIVDDDTAQLKILKNKFDIDKANYNVKAFTTGEELLVYLGYNPKVKKNISILILDYYLKNKTNKNAKDGIEILKIIKEIHPEIDIIMLSAYEDDNDQNINEIAKDAGAIEFIKKNGSSYIKIQNTIKKIICKKIFEKKKKQRSIATTIFFTLFGLVCITFALLYFLSSV